MLAAQLRIWWSWQQWRQPRFWSSFCDGSLEGRLQPKNASKSFPRIQRISIKRFCHPANWHSRNRYCVAFNFRLRDPQSIGKRSQGCEHLNQSNQHPNTKCLVQSPHSLWLLYLTSIVFVVARKSLLQLEQNNLAIILLKIINLSSINTQFVWYSPVWIMITLFSVIDTLWRFPSPWQSQYSLYQPWSSSTSCCSFALLSIFAKYDDMLWIVYKYAGKERFLLHGLDCDVTEQRRERLPLHVIQSQRCATSIVWNN